MKKILEEIKKHYVIIDTEGTGDNGVLDILKSVMNQKDKQWKDKIKLYFSKISGSEFEERQMLKNFNELTKDLTPRQFK